METVTVIIPHLGEDDQQEYALNQCMTSITETFNGNIIIAANGRKACHHEWNVHVDKQGQCKSANAAAATVNTKWLLITNDDMVYAPGWLEKLLETARRYKLKFVCPNLVEPRAGAPPFLVQPFGGAGGDFNKAAWLEFASRHVEPTLEQGFNLPFLIDREVWNIVGGYDVTYDPWGSNSDSDLQAKLILAGISTFRDRNVIIYHFSQTSGTFAPQNYEHWQANYEYFKEKWGFERQPDSNKVWYSREIIDYSSLIYHPWWKNQFSDATRPMVNFKGFRT